MLRRPPRLRLLVCDNCSCAVFDRFGSLAAWKIGSGAFGRRVPYKYLLLFRTMFGEKVHTTRVDFCFSLCYPLFLPRWLNLDQLAFGALPLSIIFVLCRCWSYLPYNRYLDR